MTIKSTYALDPESVGALDDLARRWNVSKSEALRRAIRASARSAGSRGADALRALEELQGSLGLNPAGARAWAGRTRRERRASSGRGEGRQR